MAKTAVVIASTNKDFDNLKSAREYAIQLLEIGVTFVRVEQGNE